MTDLLNSGFPNTELVFGIVSAVGTDKGAVTDALQSRLSEYGYTVSNIKVSSQLMFQFPWGEHPDESSLYTRTKGFIRKGDDIRKESGRNDMLALAAAAQIGQRRDQAGGTPFSRRAFIIDSLKHPDEVHSLRHVYSEGFFLVGVSSSHEAQLQRLKNHMSEQQARELIDLDAGETDDWGQKTSKTFQLCEFFVDPEQDIPRCTNSVNRFVDLVFADPYKTPTPDEFSMFMAFAAATSSADMSRQVGAVIVREGEILATGANEVPKAGGGRYWPEIVDGDIVDTDRGRDLTLSREMNHTLKEELIDDILAIVRSEAAEADIDGERLKVRLKKSKLWDITEYGRAVHAEMNAILSCMRHGISAKNATLYSTTYPCHNCAKHIIGAGITRVVYIEPYPKSKTEILFSDSVTSAVEKGDARIPFQPFAGIGPRRFIDLFSMSLGSGKMITREKDGQRIPRVLTECSPRIALLPHSFVEREKMAAALCKTAAGEMV